MCWNERGLKEVWSVDGWRILRRERREGLDQKMAKSFGEAMKIESVVMAVEEFWPP